MIFKLLSLSETIVYKQRYISTVWIVTINELSEEKSMLFESVLKSFLISSIKTSKLCWIIQRENHQQTGQKRPLKTTLNGKDKSDKNEKKNFTQLPKL